MPMDLAYAGAHSRGEKFGPGSRKRKPQQHPVPKEQEAMNGQIAWDEDLELIEEMQDCEYQDLPVVDDLEVAALAAEAAMEAVKIAEDNGRQPLGVTSSSSEEESSYEETMQSDGDEADEEMLGAERVAVTLNVTEQGRVEMQCALREQDDSETDSLAGSEIVDPEVLREMLSRMEEEGEDSKAAARELEEQQAGLPPVEPLDVKISQSDTLLPIGSVTAVVGDQIIVQAPKLSRAVDEGSVLCLGSRQPLGRVEELFGPVDEPLYSLRYACPTPAPADLVPGCRVFSVERLSTHVLPEAFKGRPTQDVGDGASEEGEEFEFSDDDAEAVFQRLQGPHASTSQPHQAPFLQRGGGRSASGRGRGGNARGARGEFASPRPRTDSRLQQHGPDNVPLAMPAGRNGRGHPRGGQMGRRGRGRNPPVQHPPAQDRGPSPTAGPPPPGAGQWVWVPQAAQDQIEIQHSPPTQPLVSLPRPQPRPLHPQGFRSSPHPGRGFPSQPTFSVMDPMRAAITPQPLRPRPLRPPQMTQQPGWHNGQHIASLPSHQGLLQLPGQSPAPEQPYLQSFYPHGPP